MSAAAPAVVSMRNVSHFYGQGALRKQVLFDVSADIHPGEIVIVVGPSGSGKTTLLTLAGALRSVQQGNMQVLGQQLTMDRLPEKNEFDRGDLPEGTLPEETEDLAPRLRRLRQLGRMRKDNRDLNQLWFASEAFDGDPDGCTSAGNRRSR